jgi:hypothetical protein
LGLDYHPALAFTLAVDFDGDQWQFFKFPPEDLRTLYGIEVAEMNPWRGLEHHIEEQLEMGRLLTAEVDSFYLPDTAGISYELAHVKTTIAPNMIDRDRRRLGYFHNSSYYELGDDDFSGLFGHGRVQPEVLPPYVELVKLDVVRSRGCASTPCAGRPPTRCRGSPSAWSRTSIGCAPRDSKPFISTPLRRCGSSAVRPS